jgi:hypothetical protein
MFDTIERKLFREQRYVFPEDKYTLEDFSWAFTTYRSVLLETSSTVLY